MTKYIFGDAIGSGGFAEVVEATREDNGSLWAVKHLKHPFDDSDKKRFIREVKLLSQLNHMHIVKIVGMNLDDDPPWFVMPKAKGSLSDYITFADDELLLKFFREASFGIAYAHQNGILHRDIKPENVLIFQDENSPPYAAVSDFGLGRHLVRESTIVTPARAGMGTPGYMAPEQWRDARNADGRADIYSIGKLLYHIVTGNDPMTSRMASVPSKFLYVIRKSTAEEPEDRFKSVEKFIEALDLTTTRTTDLEPPLQAILSLSNELAGAIRIQPSKIELLAKLLCDNVNEYQVLTAALPKIPEPPLGSLINDQIDLFRPVFEAYDKQVSEDLAFEYCDTVANFYRRIYFLTNDYGIRSIIVRRLPLLAFRHNRWHVGHVFAEIISQTREADLIMEVREIFLEQPDIARWCAPYLEEPSIPTIIKELIDALDE